MVTYRPRLWFSLGLSVLAAGAAMPAGAADPACRPADAALQRGEAGEAGEGAATSSTEARVQLLDVMAARLAAAVERRSAGDADDADRLVEAAVEEGPARLSRLMGRPDPALEAALSPLATAPADPRAMGGAQAAVETAIAATPTTLGSRVAALLDLVPRAIEDARDCGQGHDLASWAEARALIARAAGLVARSNAPAARETGEHLAALIALLPRDPPAVLPPPGALSALVARAQLAASDLAR